MKRLLVVVAAGFGLGAFAAFAQDSLSDDGGFADPLIIHETELEDLQRRLEVASLRFMIASEIAKIAEEESKTAVSQAEGAEQRRLKAISEATSRQSSPGRIALETARLTTGRNRAELCDLKWQLAYSCNGLPECAVELDAQVCGGAVEDGQVTDLTVQYACGKPEDPAYETRRGEFKYQKLGAGSRAFLTCY